MPFLFLESLYQQPRPCERIGSSRRAQFRRTGFVQLVRFIQCAVQRIEDFKLKNVEPIAGLGGWHARSLSVETAGREYLSLVISSIMRARLPALLRYVTLSSPHFARIKNATIRCPRRKIRTRREAATLRRNSQRLSSSEWNNWRPRLLHTLERENAANPARAQAFIELHSKT